MLDCTKVRTFTPHIPAGTGASTLRAYNAVYDILLDIYEKANLDIKTPEGVNMEEFYKFVNMVTKGLQLDDLLDGTYSVFEEYRIEVKTMQKWQFDDMPDFDGY